MKTWHAGYSGEPYVGNEQLSLDDLAALKIPPMFREAIVHTNADTHARWFRHLDVPLGKVPLLDKALSLSADKYPSLWRPSKWTHSWNDIGAPAAAAATLREIKDGEVVNGIGLAYKLTRGKLLKAPDWDDWRKSEYTQLDQYDKQGMFGAPVRVAKDDGAIFNLVWTYAVKALDQRKKARCTCDGSTRAGQVRVLDYTYANCVDQTSNRLFYALSAAENLVVFGADVSNAFGEAPPPKQGFYIRPDKAFLDWWVNHKGRDPIPPGFVIPVIRAMQGHPEAPRLWEKHADGILRKLDLRPTTHEPCL
ncbi:hypothetical protein ACHAXT_003773 [Thalassiosira profunda]